LVLLAAISQPVWAVTLLTANIEGNGVTNWTTSNPQVQALGRELAYLNPDIITFNEVPYGGATNMTNIVDTYLPGFFVAVSSSGDGYIHNGIASRYPILHTASYLHGTSLASYGYTGTSTFTRDLFEASIQVPNFSKVWDVFTAHLKATDGGSQGDQGDASQRAGEAGAVSNWFVTVYLPTNNGHLYSLSGDLNEDIYRPETNNYTSGHPIQKLVSPSPTGLLLTTPVNPFTPPTNNDLTESIQASGGLTVRFDYILPCAALYSNILSSQVFRTDVLPSPPPPLLAGDDKTASDHLPVLMTFSNPYDIPYQLTFIGVSNQTATVTWQAIAGRQYAVYGSSDLRTWTVLASNLMAVGTNLSFSTNAGPGAQFFRVYRAP
jgi:endonuclease/exonuclease/phosphatase family metal-dependent hydrolase